MVTWMLMSAIHCNSACNSLIPHSLSAVVVIISLQLSSLKALQSVTFSFIHLGVCVKWSVLICQPFAAAVKAVLYRGFAISGSKLCT